MRFWTSFLKNITISDSDKDNLRIIGLDPNKLQNDRYSSYCWFDIDETAFLNVQEAKSYTLHQITGNRTENVRLDLYLNGKLVMTSTCTVPHYQSHPDHVKTCFNEHYVRIAPLDSSRKEVEDRIAEETCSDLFARLQASTTELKQKRQLLQELQQEVGQLDQKCCLMQTDYDRLKQAAKSGGSTTPNDYRWQLRDGEKVWRRKY